MFNFGVTQLKQLGRNNPKTHPIVTHNGNAVDRASPTSSIHSRRPLPSFPLYPFDELPHWSGPALKLLFVDVQIFSSCWGWALHRSVRLEDDSDKVKVEWGLRQMVVGTRLVWECTLPLAALYRCGVHATDVCIFAFKNCSRDNYDCWDLISFSLVIIILSLNMIWVLQLYRCGFNFFKTNWLNYILL